MPNARDVIVSYVDVHQAYQIALAAEEGGRLARFYCSFFYRTGQIGRRLPDLGWQSLESRHLPGVAPDRIRENPLPFAAALGWEKIGRRLGRQFSTGRWRNRAFDSWVARQLPWERAAIFVGVQGCAAASLRAARQRGMTTILECPHPPYEEHQALGNRAAAEFGLEVEKNQSKAPELAGRRVEQSLADYLITPSEVQRLRCIQAGVEPQRVFAVPLWSDPRFFQPVAKGTRTGPLRVLFVGQLSLLKGLPYLLKAVEQCHDLMELTLVGPSTPDTDRILQGSTVVTRRLGMLGKADLALEYHRCDVLVVSSLYETFGFVGMEAMRCGTPIIVTENCGVPVPRDDWRVPVFEVQPIADRLKAYAADRGECARAGVVAAEFAERFTPESYRASIRRVLETIDMVDRLPPGCGHTEELNAT